MIRANELRIGSWVYDSIRLENVKLHGIDPSHDELWLNYCHGSGIYKLYISNVNPIPLTEEILLKCGFDKVEVEIEDYYDCSYEKQLNSDVFISYADDFSCSLFGDKSDSIKAYGVLPDWHSTNTVHGLQNLHYILTGQELKIEL